jgi:hypothetical protein
MAQQDVSLKPISFSLARANRMPQEPQVEHSLQLCLRHICYCRRPQFHPAWQLPCFRDSCLSVFAGSLEHLHDQYWSVLSNPTLNPTLR